MCNMAIFSFLRVIRSLTMLPDAVHVRWPLPGTAGYAGASRCYGSRSQHAQSMERYFTGVPGLKVVAISNAYDAKGILKSAVRDQ